MDPCVYTNCTCAELFFSEWSVKRINRFSWVDTAGTPITQGQDIPLTGAKREEGGREGGRRENEGDEQQQDKEQGRHRGDALLCFFSFFFSTFSLLSLGGCERADQRRRHKIRETKGGKAERMQANVSVWVTVCLTCSVMLVWLPLALQPASLAVRKRNVFRRNESLNRFTMWMWDSNFQTFAGRIPRKKEQRLESLAGPAGWPPVRLHCWDCPASKLSSIWA